MAVCMSWCCWVTCCMNILQTSSIFFIAVIVSVHVVYIYIYIYICLDVVWKGCYLWSGIENETRQDLAWVNGCNQSIAWLNSSYTKVNEWTTHTSEAFRLESPVLLINSVHGAYSLRNQTPGLYPQTNVLYIVWHQTWDTAFTANKLMFIL